MPQEIISRKTKTNLEILKKANVFGGFYLAGCVKRSPEVVI